MREIADGKLDAEVAVTGNDEITEMARTLSVFRDGLAEVEKANAKVAEEREAATRERRQAMMALASEFEARVMGVRSEEHTSELQSLMRTSYAVFCWKKKTQHHNHSHLSLAN